MRTLKALLLFAMLPLRGQTPDEREAIAVAQKVFNGIAAHDAALIRSAMLPEAQIVSVRDEGQPSVTSAEALATRIAALESPLLERFTSPPAVTIHGRIAQVWGEYEFLRDGKFSHCGVDAFTLLRTPEGWKVATLAYTMQTIGCKDH